MYVCIYLCRRRAGPIINNIPSFQMFALRYQCDMYHLHFKDQLYPCQQCVIPFEDVLKFNVCSKFFLKKVLLQYKLNAINFYDTIVALIYVSSDAFYGGDSSAVLLVTLIVKNSYTICSELISCSLLLIQISPSYKNYLSSSMSCEMKERPPLASSMFLYQCLCKSGRMAYL